MKLRFYNSLLGPIPSLDFKGPNEVETVEAAAKLCGFEDADEWNGRNNDKKRAALDRLANVAWQEQINHKKHPHLRLIEDPATLAIEALRRLAVADSDQVQKVWDSDIDPTAVATQLVAAIDLASANPVAV